MNQSDAVDSDGDVEVVLVPATEDLEMQRWANECIAELRAGKTFRQALALASKPAENLGKEDPPL